MIVYAHRGASSRKTENTKEAFQEAILLKAAAFETDIHRTQDGHYVLCHDDTITTTTGKRLKIAKMERNALEEQGFAFLEDTLRLFEPGMRVNVEIKDIGKTEHVHEVMDILQSFLQLEVIISSFDHSYVYGMQAIDVREQLEYALLFEAGQLQNHSDMLVALPGIEWIHMSDADVDEQMITFLHNRGFKVGVYTVDDLHRMKTLKEWGVDSVFTNYAEYAEVIRTWNF